MRLIYQGQERTLLSNCLSINILLLHFPCGKQYWHSLHATSSSASVNSTLSRHTVRAFECNLFEKILHGGHIFTRIISHAGNMARPPGNGGGNPRIVDQMIHIQHELSICRKKKTCFAMFDYLSRPTTSSGKNRNPMSKRL
mmetsp:Transcript_3597/g.7336  ORF Transcript_3597/g.7336 Transcript_3597/m.7336 type:complete len:141 (-) Transcript_3597:4748-5170(-)